MSMTNAKRSCLAAAMLTLATLAVAAPAVAQQPTPPVAPAPPADARRPGFDVEQCRSQADEFARAAIAQLESTLPAGAATEELKAAAAKAREILRDACASGAALTSPEALAAAEKATEAMLQALRTMRSAYDGFYGSLSDEQKRSLDVLGRHFGLNEWSDWLSTFGRSGRGEDARRDFDHALRFLEGCFAGRCFGEPGLRREPPPPAERRWRDQDNFGQLWRE